MNPQTAFEGTPDHVGDPIQLGIHRGQRLRRKLIGLALEHRADLDLRVDEVGFKDGVHAPVVAFGDA